jgi:hypothetical protein
LPPPMAAASPEPRLVAADDRQEAPKRVSTPGARAQAETILNDAIHFATWTDHDRALIQEQLVQLDPDDWASVAASISVAINSGKLRVETEGMPF